MLSLAGCAASSGVAGDARSREPDIAAAYLPLHGRMHLGLDSADGAAVVIAPGIAVTNAHNANLVDPKSVIGEATRLRSAVLPHRPQRRRRRPPSRSIGEAVTAYGQGGMASCASPMAWCARSSRLCRLHRAGLFHLCRQCRPGLFRRPGAGCAPGRLIGITFGYKDEGGKRLIYAYDMSRVRAELSRASQSGKISQAESGTFTMAVISLASRPRKC